MDPKISVLRIKRPVEDSFARSVKAFFSLVHSSLFFEIIDAPIVSKSDECINTKSRECHLILFLVDEPLAL